MEKSTSIIQCSDKANYLEENMELVWDQDIDVE